MLFLNVVGITDEAEHRVYFFAVFLQTTTENQKNIG